MSPEKGAALPQYGVAFTAAISSLACGTTLGWTAPAGNRLSRPWLEGIAYKVDEEDISWIVALLPFGAACSCLPMPILVRFLGRKWTMIALVVPFLIGWAFIIAASSLNMFFIGRTLQGIAVGGNFMCITPFIGEIAEKKVRGRLCSFFQLSLASGIFFAYTLGAFLSIRSMSIVCACLPFIFCCLFTFMPDSPTFLVSKGKMDEAVKSVMWLRGSNYNAEEEVRRLKEENEAQAEMNKTLKEMFQNRANRKAILISCGLMVAQQVTAVNIINFYATDIFERGGISMEPQYATVIIGCCEVCSSSMLSYMIDKIGRKVILLYSITVIATAFLLLGIYFYLMRVWAKTYLINWAPIVLLALFVIFFACGMGPLPWVICGEIFGNEIKNVGLNICCTLMWVLNFAVSKSFNDIYHSWGMTATFWMYSFPSYFAGLLIYFCVPDTVGLSLYEIQEMLAK